MCKKIIDVSAKACSILLCLLLAAFVFGCAFSAAAVSYSGAGTAENPYLVTTAEQLDGIRDNLSAHYKLAATIDLSAFGDFKPIGTIARPFTGSFTCDKNTEGFPLYAILNLKIHTPAGPYIDEGTSKWEAALFGGAEKASFENIYILNANIKNDNYGDNRGSVVYGDYKPGMDEMNSAALVGNAVECTVTGCGSSGRIDTSSNHSAGLLGIVSGGTVANSWSTVEVKSLGKWQVAGFIGTVMENATISACFSTGSAEGTQSTIGGFIGSVSQSMVQNCYATGNARDGFIARIENSTVANCYYTGASTPGGTDSAALGSTLSNVYVTQQSIHEGETKVTETELKSAFAAFEDWDTSGSLPALKMTKIPADLAGYKAGAMFGTPVQAPVAPPAGSAGQSDMSEAPSGIQSAVSDTVSAALMSAQELVALIDTLPLPEAVTLENKADIVKAKQAFDSLSASDADTIEPAAQKKLVDCVDALQALMVADLSARIEALPAAEELGEKDAEEVEAIWKDYSFLDEDYQSFISEDLRAKLEDCMKALETPAAQDTSGAAFTSAELLVLFLLAVVIVLNAATNIVITVTLFRRKRQAAAEQGGES